MNIFLVGMPGCGKSTIGKILADALGLQYIDMDREIEKETGKSIPEIFAEKGESHFRFLEKKLLRMLAQKDNQVVATGGGVPAHNGNMELINSCGISIYLEASTSQLIENLGESINNRPLLAGENKKEKLDKLIQARRKFYESALHTISVRGTTEDTIKEIIAVLRS